MISQIPVAEVAAVTARALENLLGHDVVLTCGDPELGDPADDILPEGTTRAIVLPFSDGAVGEVTLVVGERFATALEAATDDASLTTATVPALEAGAYAIALTMHLGVSTDYAGEIATETLLTSVTGEFAAVPVLENDTRVACVIVRIVDDEPGEVPTPVPAAAPSIPAPPALGAGETSPSSLSPSSASYETATTPVAAADPHVAIALHEFQPLGDGASGTGPTRPLTLLNDVSMEVTAELGRRRMKVRDIVGLQPGSVVELDRAAGSPVDVLVNGALVWHGEVVIVDEEFGIRVSDIVVDEH
jgi:flagellar motor switch protein FliN